MGTKLTDEDKIGMSPAEIAALEADDADTLLAKHGGNVDDDESVDNDDGEQAEAAAPAPAPTAAAESESVQEATAEAEEAEAPAPAPGPQPLKVDDTDFAAERKKLTAEKREIEAKWSAGEEGCTDEWRIAELERIDDARDDLLRRQTRADTLREHNEQMEAQRKAEYDGAVNAATKSLLESSKKDGAPINYATDTKAQKQFDNALNMVEADPDASSMSPAQRVAEAHRLVMARRGIVQQAAAPAPAPTPSRTAPPAREVPVTLGGLPNAGRDTPQDDVLAELNNLSGEDYEMRLASLPAGTVEKLLRQSDRNAAVVN
jgi:hypothetical protein